MNLISGDFAHTFIYAVLLMLASIYVLYRFNNRHRKVNQPMTWGRIIAYIFGGFILTLGFLAITALLIAIGGPA